MKYYLADSGTSPISCFDGTINSQYNYWTGSTDEGVCLAVTIPESADDIQPVSYRLYRAGKYTQAENSPTAWTIYGVQSSGETNVIAQASTGNWSTGDLAHGVQSDYREYTEFTLPGKTTGFRTLIWKPTATQSTANNVVYLQELEYVVKSVPGRAGTLVILR